MGLTSIASSRWSRTSARRIVADTSLCEPIEGNRGHHRRRLDEPLLGHDAGHATAVEGDRPHRGAHVDLRAALA